MRTVTFITSNTVGFTKKEYIIQIHISYVDSTTSEPFFYRNSFLAIVYATWENLRTKSATMANIAMDTTSSFL